MHVGFSVYVMNQISCMSHPPSPRLSTLGGAVETGPVSVYPIFYGTWVQTDARVGLVSTLLRGLPQTPVWNVLEKYGVTRQLVVEEPTFTGAPLGMSWSSLYVCEDVILQVFLQKRKAPSLDAIPVLIVSPDVSVPELGRVFCGEHSVVQGMPYILLGDPLHWPACTFSRPPSSLPMASTLFHEIVEVLTDPQLNAWVYPANDYEAGDLCAWNLVPLQGAPNGYYTTRGVNWNVNISGSLFLIQSVWDPVLGRCSLGEGTTAAALPPPRARLPVPPAFPTPAPAQPPPFPPASRASHATNWSVLLLITLVLAVLVAVTRPKRGAQRPRTEANPLFISPGGTRAPLPPAQPPLRALS